MSKIYFLFFIIFSSCAKLSYMTTQGIGQISIEWNGKSNKAVLEDPNVPQKFKDKIRLIQKYKKYFYSYFGKSETDIYTETTFLEDSAVTYLVIASRKDRVHALNHSFFFVGDFPYKGFFSQNDADLFIKKLKRKNYSTFKRPVYAYSTLDRTPFDDNILSSFFVYSDEKLAELIFHELTHTLLFIDGEVSLNESLAEVIARDLFLIYFKKNQTQRQEHIYKLSRNQNLNLLISEKVKELNRAYERSTNPTKTLNTFIVDNFNPSIKQICNRQKLKKCWPLDVTWNNARFAAFETYQAGQSVLEKIKKKWNLNPKQLLHFVDKAYSKYNNSSRESSFEEYLKKKGMKL